MNRANSHRVFKRLFLVFALAGLAVVFVLTLGVRPMQAQGNEHIDIVVNPSTLTANGASTATITVTVWNSGTLLLPVQGVMLTGYVSPSTLGGIITPFGPTNSKGQAISTWTAGTVAGTGELIIRDGNVTSTASITLTAGALETIIVSPNSVAIPAGTTYAFTAAGYDHYWNDVAIAPTWTTNGGSINPSGVFTAQTSVAAGRRVTATQASVSGVAVVDIIAGPPHAITLEAKPVSLVVGNSSVLTATVYDSFDNRVEDNTSVTFTMDRPGTILSPRMTTNGIATSRVTVMLASVAHITATSGAAQGTTTVNFTPGEVTTITVQVNPPNLIANSSATAAITATATDRYRNPVQGIVLTGTTEPSSLGTVGNLSATDANGRAFGTWTAGTTVGGGLLRVRRGAVSGTASISLVYTNPQTVTIQVISSTLFANSGMSTTVTAIVSDTYGNPFPGATLNFSLSPFALGTVTSSVTTDANGRASNTWTAGSFIGSGQLIADAGGGVSSTAAVTLTVDAPYTLTLQAGSTSPVVGIGSVLTATVRDRYSNLVASGFLITFTTDLGSVLSPGTTVDGVATSFVFARLAGTAHITATCESISGATMVSFVPDVSSELLLQAAPPLQIVGNSSVLTATVRDQYGNSVANGTIVSLTSSLGSVISPVTTTNGIAASSVSSTLPGIANIVATSGVAQGTASATFVLDASATTTSVQLGTDTLIVNSNTTTPITVTVFDFYNNPIPGITVTAYLSPTTLGDLTWQNPTDPNGVVLGFWAAGTVPGSGMLIVGNSSIAVSLVPRRVFLPVMMRGFPPTPVNKSLRINGGAEFTYQITVTLEVSATIQNDYVEWMHFSNDGTHWSDWLTFAPTTTWKLAANNGLATVYAQFKGHKGGISAVTSDDIFLFKNGDFSQPNLVDWTQDPNSRLSVSRSTDPVRPGNPAGLLGSPAYGCNSVPIGYASLSQPFIVPAVPAGKGLVLEFSYHIFTYDRNVLLDDKGDRFDVLFNSIRVLRGMNRNLQYQCSTVYDLGRKIVSIPVVGNPGDNVNVTFRLYNWPDHLYNTYVYLDDVHLRYVSLMRMLESR